MLIEFMPVNQADRDALVAFMSGQSFPFHVSSKPTVDEISRRVDTGQWWSSVTQGYWVDVDGQRVGFVALEDLEDPTPLFDLRLAEDARGKGLGSAVLSALTAKVFTELSEVDRFEGQTRDDNIAMRRVMEKCGWVQEACYRESWPDVEGRLHSSIAYAMLRRDWEQGTTTPINWNIGE